MQNHSVRFQNYSIASFLLRLCTFGFLLLVVFVLSGCAVVEYFKREGPPSDEELYESYNQTELKVSGAGEVLAMIHDPEYELLSRSKSVIASSGQKKKGYKSWFNMVAFDETKLTANRKHFFSVDEKPKTVPFRSKRRLRFESKMVMESEVLDEPYVNRNARRIAILEQVLANFHKDVDEVKADNKKLDSCRMLMNWVLETILRDLDESPVLASKLSSTEGVNFDHITLGKGRIWMEVAEDIVDVKVVIDSFVGTLDDPFALDR
jgi:hypothetical protein